MVISIESTVGDLAAEGINRTRVFETYGIDYCCGGRATLAEACQKAGCSFSPPRPPRGRWGGRETSGTRA